MCIRDRSKLPIYIMGEDQLSRYALFMATLGNRPHLFPASSYVDKYITVSYTHLDVYKRQNLYLARRPGPLMERTEDGQQVVGLSLIHISILLQKLWGAAGTSGQGDQKSSSAGEGAEE